MGPQACKHCYLRAATTEDVYGDHKPLCAWCMDDLDRHRWASEHGMPVPAPGALWDAPDGDRDEARREFAGLLPTPAVQPNGSE